MIKEIKLDVANFGPIENASLNIKKLNVVGGVNGSGKSTISKLLFCFLTAISKERYYLLNKSIYDRLFSLILHWSNRFSLNKNNIDNTGLQNMGNVFGNMENFNDAYLGDYFKNMIFELKNIVTDLDFLDKTQYLNNLDEIDELITLNEDEKHRYFNVITFLLDSEFDFDVLDAKVIFQGIGDDCNFEHIVDFDLRGINAAVNGDCLNFENIVYIDNPSVFDFKTSDFISTNSYHLRLLSRLLHDQNNSDDVFAIDQFSKTNEFNDKFRKIIGGNVFFDSKTNAFMFSDGKNTYSMKNTASGVKQLGVILRLLDNHSINKNTFLILDNPEVNLHPEWQIRLAELIILMIKELNVHVYVNSYSTLFIEALEVFSIKYSIIDDSGFYLSDKYSFKEVSKENMVEFYDNLGKPYGELDRIRVENSIMGK